MALFYFCLSACLPGCLLPICLSLFHFVSLSLFLSVLPSAIIFFNGGQGSEQVDNFQANNNDDGNNDKDDNDNNGEDESLYLSVRLFKFDAREKKK